MSAGTPLRTKRQAEAQREAYMNSLKMEVSNIQKNYNANEIYKATGTASIPKSTETITERASDDEGKKLLIRNAVVSAGIMNSFVADNFLATLGSDDLTFFLSHQAPILEGFKPKNVPATVFGNYFKKYQKKFGETLGIEYGLQQGGGTGFAMDATLMQKALTENRAGLEQLKVQVSQTFDRATAKTYIDTIDALLAKMPTQEEFRKIEQLEADEKQKAYEDLGAFLENLPDMKSLVASAQHHQVSPQDPRFTQAEKKVQERLKQKEVEEAMRKTAEANAQLKQFKALLSAQKPKLIKDLATRQDLSGASPEQLAIVAELLQVDQGIIDSGDVELLKNAILAQATVLDANEPADLKGKTHGVVGPEGTTPTPGATVYDPVDDIPDDLKQAYADIASTGHLESADAVVGMDQQSLETYLNALHHDIARAVGRADVFPILDAQGDLHFIDVDDLLDLSPDDLWDSMNMLIQASVGPAPAPAQAQAGFPPVPQTGQPKGNGLRGRGLRKTPVEKSDGYVKPVQYTQFGRYMIHHPKLKQGILQMKTPKGGAIKALPSVYLSPRVKDTMLTLVGNGIPSLEDFDKLTHDEKDQLHHITKHAEYEKATIPKGNMDKEDQMIHKFTVLKGELLAGNNNKQLLKEFKSMLIKFVEDGRIPRRQANEILVELAKEGM